MRGRKQALRARCQGSKRVVVPLTEQELRENKRRQDAAYYARNRKRLIQKSLQYQKDHAAQINAKHEEWRRSHLEVYRKASARYAKLHPDRIKATTQKYYHTKVKTDPVAKRRAQDSSKRWKKRHPEYQMEHYHRYKLTPHGKAKIRAASLKRRALKKAATINLAAITEWLKRIRSKTSAVCYYCDKRIPASDIHIDHIVALAKGGAHSVENLCVSCNSCNSSKGAKPVRTWIRMGQQILEL